MELILDLFAFLLVDIYHIYVKYEVCTKIKLYVFFQLTFEVLRKQYKNFDKREVESKLYFLD